MTFAWIALGISIICAIITVSIFLIEAELTPADLFYRFQDFREKHKRTSLKALCKQCDYPIAVARAMYYARATREEDERLKHVHEILKDEKELPYYKDNHFSVEKDEYGATKKIIFPTLDNHERLRLLQIQKERFAKLGLFPNEEKRQYRCEKCKDTGEYTKHGDKRLCRCWVKPVKKWLLQYRNRMDNFKEDYF